MINIMKICAIGAILFVTGCSAVPDLEEGTEEPRLPLPEQTEHKGAFAQYDDPWEGFNRRMYYFNAKADEHVILPVVNGYKAVTPDIVETGVSNFFSNLGEIPVFINTLLQFKLDDAAETFGRFVVNSTIGLAGILDVATPMGLDKQDEDFGQTLGYWGLGPGPYLVLPLLGPSSLRDATGTAIDMFAYQAAIDELGMKDEEELFLSLLRGIDTRSNVPFKYYASGSAFEYERLKILYMKYREIQISR